MSWDLDLDKASWFFGPGQGQIWTAGFHARWLSQWAESWRCTNSQHRKIVSLSPRVENLNLKKVIKVLYQNQKRVVSVSRFSDSYAYEHSINIMNVCTFHIFVSWSYLEYITICLKNCLFWLFSVQKKKTLLRNNYILPFLILWISNDPRQFEMPLKPIIKSIVKTGKIQKFIQTEMG